MNRAALGGVAPRASSTWAPAPRSWSTALLARGDSLAVLDVAPNALAQVRARLGSEADRVEWFATHPLDFAPPHEYDLWHDRAACHALRDPG